MNDKFSLYQQEISSLRKELSDLQNKITEHSHDGVSSKRVSGGIRSNSDEFHHLGSGGLSSAYIDGDTEILIMYAGSDETNNLYTPKVSPQRDKNTFLYLRSETTGTAPSRLYATGVPTLASSTKVSVTSSSTSIDISSLNAKENELIDCHILFVNVSDPNKFILRRVTANTNKVATIAQSVGVTGNYNIAIFKGVLIGDTQIPFRRLNIMSEDFGGIRFGGGATGDGQNGLLYMTSAGVLAFRKPNGTVVNLA
jgi:hypothetical protein